VAVAKRSSKVPKPAEADPEGRPQGIPTPGAGRLSGIIGQDRAVGVLRTAAAAGRVHHAWIFHGPVGVGKFTAALAFAADLLDPASRAGESGVASEARRLLEAGIHPDLHVVRKELAGVSRDERVRRGVQRNIAKEVLAEFLIEPAGRTRVFQADSAAAKVFIVDEAELLEPVGQNALLKTLEEPPRGTVIILVTSAEERLLPTIRSRCQRVAFTPLDEASMGRWLEAGGLLAGVPEADRGFVLRFAGGSPGAATLAVKGGLVAWHRTIGPMLAETDRGRYCAGLGPAMASLVDEWAKAHAQEREHASKDAANKAGAAWMLRLLAAHYRERLRSSPRDGARAIEAIAEAQRQADAGVQFPFVMENLAAQLAERPR
jgi:DNA polymerase-3 subunit delta'